jgi:hypothetical protein
VARNTKHENYQLPKSDLSHKTLAHDISSNYQLLEGNSSCKTTVRNIKFRTFKEISFWETLAYYISNLPSLERKLIV